MWERVRSTVQKRGWKGSKRFSFITAILGVLSLVSASFVFAPSAANAVTSPATLSITDVALLADACNTLRFKAVVTGDTQSGNAGFGEEREFVANYDAANSSPIKTGGYIVTPPDYTLQSVQFYSSGWVPGQQVDISLRTPYPDYTLVAAQTVTIPPCTSPSQPTLTVNPGITRNCSDSTNAPYGTVDVPVTITNADVGEAYDLVIPTSHNPLYGVDDNQTRVATSNTLTATYRIYSVTTTGAYTQAIQAVTQSKAVYSNVQGIEVPACPPPPPPANNPPVANPDAVTTTSNTVVTFNVTSNDTDPDGNALTVTSVSQPTNGTASQGTNGLVTYQSNAGFTGTDTFTYVISDGNGGTATGTVTVTVNAEQTPPPTPNQAPVARLTVTPDRGTGPLVVQADASASSDDQGIVKYTFVWGDGTSTSVASPTYRHAYRHPGRYTVRLIVTDAQNLHGYATESLVVLARTPRVTSGETPGQGQMALRDLSVSNRPYAFPRGQGSVAPVGYKYVTHGYVLLVQTSSGFAWKLLYEGYGISPTDDTVGVLLGLVKA